MTLANEPSPLLTSQTRLFITENGAGPANAPVYKGRARASNVQAQSGQLTPIRQPSSTQYGQFVTVGIQRGQPNLPTVTFESRLDPDTISEFLKLFNKQCEFDAQLHVGTCEDPADFTGGWRWVRIFEQIRPSQYSNAGFGTFDESNEAPIVDSLDVAAQRIYDVGRLRASEVAAAEITDECVDVIIADSITCGQCGRVSDGCQVAFILVGDTSGSPGLPAELLYTEDGGSTWGTTHITSLGLTNGPTAMAAVGTNLVVVSHAGANLHYASIADILDGVESWTAVSTGFDGAGAPNGIASVARDRTWICGDAGRVYFTEDPTSGVTEQADGSQTAQNLTRIHAFDREHVLAVGASNAVLVTSNHGTTWAAVTGPTPGVALTACWMRTVNEWIVGTTSGLLYYTRNAGSTWTSKGFPGSGGGTVRDIKFASKNVGYMSHNTAAPAGRMLRTIDGGNSWYVLPEEAGLSIPANDRMNRIAPCVDDPNVVFGVGLADTSQDGFAVKFS